MIFWHTWVMDCFWKEFQYLEVLSKLNKNVVLNFVFIWKLYEISFRCFTISSYKYPLHEMWNLSLKNIPFYTSSTENCIAFVQTKNIKKIWYDMMTLLQKGRFWLNPTNKVCIFYYGSKSFLFMDTQHKI